MKIPENSIEGKSNFFNKETFAHLATLENGLMKFTSAFPLITLI